MIWKNIVKYPDYLISENGDIKNSRTGNILKQRIHKNGYLTLTIKPLNHKSVNFKIHRMLAEAFIPNPENKPFINHIDGNKLNNSLNNLEWCTSSENAQHAHDNKLIDQACGERKNNAKLSKELIEKIKSEVIPGDRNFGYRALAKKYNMSHSTIITSCSESAKNKSWKHLR